MLQPFGMPRRPDFIVAPLRFAQQAQARRVVAEDGGEFGAPFEEEGGKRRCTGALDPEYSAEVQRPLDTLLMARLSEAMVTRW